MRRMHLTSAVTALTLAATACAPGIEVHTVVSPEARLESLRTFRILPVPKPRADRPLPPHHPMLLNSITSRALRADLVRAFETHGYSLDDSSPDFAVAYYASTREKLEVTYWDYGYPWRPRWWRGWGRPWGGAMVTQYTEGTLIIDVIDPQSQELLWRGRGITTVSNDEQEYLAQLRKAVTAILDRFPHAQAAVAEASTVGR